MIAIIGTAGRDKTKPMTRDLWDWMLADARARVPVDAQLVSGGAAWADHLAVALYLTGHASALTLHLPAPFDGQRFVGPASSSASAANYYHVRFSLVTGDVSTAQLARAIAMGATVTEQPARPGYGGMFARNAKVAADASRLIAYTFGQLAPTDGGTGDAWDKCRGQREHVTLPLLFQDDSKP